MLSLARLFDAVTAKRGLFKTISGPTLLCIPKYNKGFGRFDPKNLSGIVKTKKSPFSQTLCTYSIAQYNMFK